MKNETAAEMNCEAKEQNKLMRDKYWQDSDQEEKTERMRWIVKNLQNKVERLENLVFGLSHHQHCEKTGKLLSTFDFNRGITGMAKEEKASDKVFF